MNPIDPAETFLLEAADLLAQIEEIALGLDQHPDDSEAVHRLFRAFHTLKGSGAMFGYEAVAAFTHHVETALDEVRNGRLPVTPELLALLLASRDQIGVLLHDPANAAARQECARLVTELESLRAPAVPAAAAQSETAQAVAPTGADASAIWQIRFKPALTLALRGTDPIAMLDDLRRLGTAEVAVDETGLPAWEEFNPEHCYFAWNIRLTSSCGLNAIKDVFIFVEDECELGIDRVGSAAGQPAAVGEVPAPAPSVVPAAPVANSTTPAPGAPRKAAAEGMVRVPSAKLDRLVNLVGEFVMNQSRLAQVAQRLGSSELEGPVEAIERLVDELRDSVLGIRMMPIGSTFGRFKRLVHDLSRELGKEIDLVTEGGETELDKTVLDQLGDPLVHLIRNSLDHGIESPEERRRLAKPARGIVRLTAAHAGSHVVVSIQDDGRGLDRDAIRAKALEKGLIAADAALSDHEVFSLVFLPGFSTAREITSVSGRGVGMDVVKRQVEALRGTIQVASERGAGTTISLRLPLTLAIIDGLLVQLAADQFIVPMAAVMENVELTRAERSGRNGRNVIAVRGDLVPFIRLRELFALPEDGPVIEKVVIVNHEGRRVGIVVDRVLGSHQTVIQSLGRFYRHVEVCSGSTIMGDGRVALVIDLPGLVRRAQTEATRPACAA